jgi:hypothetical protein
VRLLRRKASPHYAKTDSLPTDVESAALPRLEPVRLRNEALMSEYRALRSELDIRVGKQQEITSFSIALVAGFLALSQFLGSRSTLMQTLVSLKPYYPFASIVFSAFSLMTLDHEMNIAHITLYLDSVLRPQIQQVLQQASASDDVMQWPAIRAAWQQHAGWANPITTSLASAKYATTVLPTLGLALAYVLGPGDIHLWRWASVPYFLSIALIVWVLVCATYISRLYLRMRHVGIARRPL